MKVGLDNVWNDFKSKSIFEGEEIDGMKTECSNKQPVIKKEGLNL